MKLTASQREIIYAAFAVVLLGGILVGAALTGHQVALENGAAAEAVAMAKITSSPQTLHGWVNEQAVLQDEVDDLLIAELESGAYNLTEPLVVLDPYHISPLTALIIFTTGEAVNIAIHVPGKDELSCVDFSFNGYNTNHMIPVYGLYADMVNQVELTTQNQSGQQETVIVPIETQPLPDVIQNLNASVELAQPSKYQPGFNFTYSSTVAQGAKFAFDVNGDVRWLLEGDYLQATNYDINGHIFISMGSMDGEAVIFETNPMGKLYTVFYSPYGAHHDIVKYHEHYLLVTGSNADGINGIIEDFIYELDLNEVEFGDTLDLKEVFSRARPGTNPYGLLSVEDWLHLNAIVEVAGEDSVLISCRGQSLISKISWPEGEIEWISSYPEGYLPMYEQYLLEPIGENFEYHYMQHAPLILPDYDNDPFTMDILVFDNGQARPLEDGEELYTRLVHYRINEKEMTIEQMDQYGKELGLALYADARGDVDLLSNGNWFASYSVVIPEEYVAQEHSVSTSVYLEIDENHDLVWMAELSTNDLFFNYVEYRSDRMLIYNETANNLGVGHSARD